MSSSILTATASSPSDLEENLSEIQKTNPNEFHFVSMVLRDPKVLVSPFCFDGISLKELKTKLMFESVGLLSLPVNDIELDYQILVHENGKLQGIFICIPKTLLKEYLKIANEAKLIPLEITSCMLASLDSFLLAYGKQKGRLCLMDFYKETIIHLAVFHEGQCELLREIQYESLTEACSEVIQSLRSVYARSPDKQCQQIYCCGNLDDKNDLIQELGKDFKLNVTPKKTTDGREGLPADPGSFFRLNLIRNYEVSLKERHRVFAAMRLLILMAAIGCVYLSVQIFKILQETKTVAGSYNKTNYEYAQRLQQQVKSLGP